jgi:glycine/D-amino acid oxidase-like deaminating enzyme
MNLNPTGKVFGEAQVVVLGAGVIGCSIAYHLARRGIAVTVVDAKGIGTGTSSATLGLVWVQRKEPVEYMELNLLSSKLHVELAKTFDEDVELNQPGGISTYLDEATYLKQLAVMDQLNVASQNHQTKALTPTQARQLEPELSLEIVGALFSPHDGEINPIKLVFNLTRNAKKCGAKFLTQTPVIRITRDEEGVTGVDVRQGLLSARKVVVAAGTGCALLVQSLGVEMPQVSERGQILVTEAIRRVLVYPTGISRQTVRGNILLGTTYEANCGERLTTAEGAKKIANDSIRRYPVLKDVQIIRNFAGIRPLPKDGLPYLGAVNRVPGLFIATSHSGITLAPVHGKVISELIIDGKTDVPLQSYRPERFTAIPAKVA